MKALFSEATLNEFRNVSIRWRLVSQSVVDGYTHQVYECATPIPGRVYHREVLRSDAVYRVVSSIV